MDGDETWFDPEATTFGDRLAGAREAAGLDQKAMAERLGVRLKTLRAWENDQAEPRANRLSIMAGMLNVTIRWLMNGDGEGPSTAAPASADLLSEVSALRREADAMSDRLARLERRLRKMA